MPLYEHSGNASYTATLAADLTSGSTSMSVNTGGGTGFPTGASTHQFWLVIDPGAATEEKVLATARSGDTFTGLTRGQDGTAAAAHTAGVKVYHIFSQQEAADANNHVFDTTRDDHTQYTHNTTARTVSAAHTFTGGPTFSTVAPTFSAGAALGTGNYSGNLVFTGSPTVTGSVSGYTGGELRLGSTASGNSGAITTQSTGAPLMAFDHRGTSNTGTWRWNNGTGAATQLMSLDATGLLTINSNDIAMNAGSLRMATGTGRTAGTATAGGGAALPATVAFFWQVKFDGTAYKVPVYSN